MPDVIEYIRTVNKPASPQELTMRGLQEDAIVRERREKLALLRASIRKRTAWGKAREARRTRDEQWQLKLRASAIKVLAAKAQEGRRQIKVKAAEAKERSTRLRGFTRRSACRMVLTGNACGAVAHAP